MVAEYQQRLRNWPAAEAMLAPLAADPDTSWEIHATHGHVLAELGRWSEAQRAFRAALGRRPDSTQLLYYESLARVVRRRRIGSRHLVYGGAQEVRHDTQSGSRPLARQAVRIVGDARRRDEHPGSRPRSDRSGSGARHRAPRRRLCGGARSCAGPRAGGETPRRTAGPPASPRTGRKTQLLLALAQRQLGRTRESGRTLSRYEDATARLTLPWHRRIEADTWLRRTKGGG